MKFLFELREQHETCSLKDLLPGLQDIFQKSLTIVSLANVKKKSTEKFGAFKMKTEKLVCVGRTAKIPRRSSYFPVRLCAGNLLFRKHARPYYARKASPT